MLSLFKKILYAVLALSPLLYAADPERPKIEDVAAIELPINPSWENTKVGLARLILQLDAFYPDEHLFFIARDGEFVYDMARVLLSEEPKKLKRMHLINVSRDNLTSPRFKRYLEENGLTEKKTQGKGIVLIDTGFVGTVPLAIREAVSPEVSQKIHPHFILSGNPTVPSSRFFLTALGPWDISTPTESLRQHINQFEHLSHYGGKSHDYVEDPNGTLIPIAPKIPDEKERNNAIALMQDIKAYALRPIVKQDMDFYGKQLTLVMKAFLGQRSFMESDVLAAARHLQGFQGIQGFYADLNDLSLKHRLKLSSKEVGEFLALFPQYKSLFNSPERQQKIQLESAHPHLKAYLQTPWETIPNLKVVKDNLILEQLIALRSEELYAILCSEVFSKAGAEKRPGLIKAMLSDPASHRWLIATVLNKPYWLNSPQGLKLVNDILEQGTADRRIVDFILSLELVAKNPQALQLLETVLQRGKAKENLNNTLFSKKWWKDHPTLRRLLQGAEPTAASLNAILAQGQHLLPSRSECVTAFEKAVEK